ncbi:MAG TPA: hypothetical protein VEA60_06420 [Allosphingosinicella sp.]|nr:hypothetical protein [Allosphingosinicella sp.]
MSNLRGRSRWGALGLAGIAAAAAPVLALAVPEALAKLEPGRWQLRHSDGADARSLCLADPAMLVQLEHHGASCGQELLASGAGAATVEYSCPGRGFGRTSIRVETPRLARIDTQGLADGRPFAYRVEARRVGAC